MRNNNILRRTTALAGGVCIIGFLAAAPAAAADGTSGDVEVVNTETVQTYMTADGDIDTKRVYEQLALTGKGSVDLTNPIATSGVRNLDGFTDVEVEDGEQLINTDVDGEKKLRSVSDFKGDLPLAIDVNYELDGRTVEPGDLVGKSGKLEVTFDVENVTGEMQEVEIPDGKGGTITKTVDVPIPMVGSLSTVAPENFNNVASEQANLAGDGQGGTKVSFTMTLFPPVGSNSATFGYTADVRDGVVPKIEVSALPINPLESPTFASAAESYQGGADTGAKLTDGAVEIDANLLRLRDGAAELLAGLIKLRDGSGELSAGLNDTAVPGSAKLAAGAEELSLGLLKLDDGAGKLSDGAGELNNGLGKIDDGAGRLATGAGDASAGSDRLADGANRLEGGLGELGTGTGDLDSGANKLAKGQKDLLAGLKQLEAGIKGLPKSVQDKLAKDVQYLTLLGALQAIADGIDNQILPGLQGIEGSLRTQFGNIDAIAGGLETGANTDNLGPVKQALVGLSGANGCAAPGNPPPAPVANPQTECELISAVYHGVIKGQDDAGAKIKGAAGLLTDITAGLRAGLFDNDDAAFKQLRAGLSHGDATNCLTPGSCGIREGVLFLKNAGIPALVSGITANIEATLLQSISAPAGGCKPDSKTLICGGSALAAGGDELTEGIDTLVAGVTKLNTGGAQLSAGATELSSGLGRLDAGAGELADGTETALTGSAKLADGAGQLADGTGKASDGGSQVADGAGQLADGLKDAGEGSTKLFEGLVTAANGAPKLEGGAQRLSDEGTKKLIAAGESTTSEYGELVSVIKAGAERGSAEKMAFGAPEDAVGLTAYSYIIKGEDGESGRNLTRALGGLAVFGAAGGMFLLRRRGVI